MRPRRSLRAIHGLASLAALVAAAAAWGECNGVSSMRASTGGGGPAETSVAATSGAGGTIIHDDASGAGGAGAKAKPSCGGGCTPGTGTAAACEPSPSSNGGAGGTGGAGSGGNAGTVDGTCQLAVVGDVLEGLCGLAGASKDGEPCLSMLDCAAGFGCVQPGVCRAYCCGDPEECPAKTYCTARPVATEALAPSGEGLQVPVCAPAEPCTLLDDASCAADDETCTIVRADGTTSCVTPGEGEDGGACPCAPGFVCSFGQNTCMRLCHTNVEGDCPSGHQCSGGSKPYPAGFGVCVSL